MNMRAGKAGNKYVGGASDKVLGDTLNRPGDGRVSNDTPAPPPALSKVWKGCGHKMKMILLCDCPTCFAPYALFLQDNPKELCFECWQNDNQHAGVADKCPKFSTRPSATRTSSISPPAPKSSIRLRLKKLRNVIYSKTIYGRGLMWAHKGTRRYLVKKDEEE